MPPSPQVRLSPARERRLSGSAAGDGTHKRGRSFETSLLLESAKDDDLALFSDMWHKERESFLLQPADDFDESISKLRHSSDLKLGGSISSRGKSTDLLNGEADKNDYDWLLTPPETPLFPSLDDDDPRTPNRSMRGRQEPVFFSRSSTMEKTQRTSRASASPNRRSPSPHSNGNASQKKTGPSPSTHCSPPPNLRPLTPVRRSSPQTRSSTAAQRSPSPTLRRLNTDFNVEHCSSGRRGTSPVRAARGASASPNPRGFQSGLAGFSYDAPPNLRTSFPDRPTSRSRGTSPASHSDFAPKFRRQSMSPTPSRSASSSRSYEQDLFSSFSKASSEDDVNSLQSIQTGLSSFPPSRGKAPAMKSRPVVVSKKPSKTSFGSSAPKRSFDSASWLMDQRKSQNRFRPLLQSISTTAFGAGQTSSFHHPVLSGNSSVTTSSNAGSEHAGISAMHAESDCGPNELTGQWEKLDSSDAQDDIFGFDKMDEADIIDSCTKMSHSLPQNFDQHAPSTSLSLEHHAEAEALGELKEHSGSQNLQSLSDGDLGAQYCQLIATCSRCEKEFSIVDDEQESDICQECASLYSADYVMECHTKTSHGYGAPLMQNLSTRNSSGAVNHEVDEQWDSNSSISGPGLVTDVMETTLLKMEVNAQSAFVLEPSSEMTCCETDALENNLRDSVTLAGDCDVKEQRSDKHLDDHHRHNFPVSNSDVVPNYHIDGAECTSDPCFGAAKSDAVGLPVLLQKSSSTTKCPVTEGRLSRSLDIVCSEPHYARDVTNCMKRSSVRDSCSVTSSIDLESSKNLEHPTFRHFGGMKMEMEKAPSAATVSGLSSASDMSVSSSSVTMGPKSYGMEDFILSMDGPETKSSAAVASTEPYDCAGTEWSNNEHAADNEHAALVMHRLSSEKSSGLGEEDNLSAEPHDISRFSNEDELKNSDCCSEADCLAETDLLLNACLDNKGSSNSSVVQEPSSDHSISNELPSERNPLEKPSASTADSETPEIPPNINEEMVVPVELPSLEEEALDASSISHDDLADKAISISIGKDELDLHESPPHQLTAMTAMNSTPKQTNLHPSFPNKHTNHHSRMVKRKRPATSSPPRQVGEAGKNFTAALPKAPLRPVDSARPPKLEAKCNCAIM